MQQGKLPHDASVSRYAGGPFSARPRFLLFYDMSLLVITPRRLGHMPLTTRGIFRRRHQKIETAMHRARLARSWSRLMPRREYRRAPVARAIAAILDDTIAARARRQPKPQGVMIRAMLCRVLHRKGLRQLRRKSDAHAYFPSARNGRDS